MMPLVGELATGETIAESADVSGRVAKGEPDDFRVGIGQCAFCCFPVTISDEALQTMPNQRHAYVWAKYHGINDDGTLGDKWTFDGIAKQMPGGVVTREYVENSYYRACTHVYRTISVAALNRLRVAMSSY